MAKFEDRLKELRTEKRLTHAQLAQRAGVTESAISMWETGQRFPRKSTMVRLCEIFDVSHDYLLGVSDIRNAEVQMRIDAYHRVLADPNGPEAQEMKRNANIALQLLRKYGALTESHKQAVDDMIDMYYEKDKK